MSGHSKWSKVKHQKGKVDKLKGQSFTRLANNITIAVKEGGARLRLAIEKARSMNMPKNNIDRAIERGLGKGKEGQIEKITYEGFSPGNAALIIETATDNRQRTYSSLKNTFHSFGGNLGSPGSALYMFKTLGSITLTKTDKTEDEYTQEVIECGGSDLEFVPDKVVVYTDMTKLYDVKLKLEKLNETVETAEIVFYPINQIQIEAIDMEKTSNLITALEEIDDVLKVTTNIA